MQSVEERKDAGERSTQALDLSLNPATKQIGRPRKAVYTFWCAALRAQRQNAEPRAPKRRPGHPKDSRNFDRGTMVRAELSELLLNPSSFFFAEHGPQPRRSAGRRTVVRAGDLCREKSRTKRFAVLR